MAQFAPGMRIIVRDEEWMIRKIEQNILGNEALYCVGISSLVQNKDVTFLTDLEDINIVDPSDTKLVVDSSPMYSRALVYIESQWRQQVPTDSNLYVGHKAAMDLMEYQLEPAKKALSNTRQRLLIADNVGLGKTLEAGILMSELIKRGKGKRILVVTVKSMMAQFQQEMWNRFTIPLVSLDSAKIRKIRENLPSNYNPFFRYDKSIISMDTLKQDVEYRTHLENAYWDIIVIDEAQNVASRGDKQAKRSRLASLLADRSDTMIMLSATPHDGRAKSFASLMNMLDPTAIANDEEYNADECKDLFIRRFKKDIMTQLGNGGFLKRNIIIEKCIASDAEEKAFKVFANMNLLMDTNKEGRSSQLFKISLEKSMFSSPAACITSIDNRLKKLRKKYPDEEFVDIYTLKELKESLKKITPIDFSRYQRLLKLLKDKAYGWNPKIDDDRLVIFTERIETMKYLAENLQKDLKLKGNAIQTMDGSMSDVEQQQIVDSFGNSSSPVRILVASDVASEGLNLHYLSHRMIHFDIPWSLMVFQQRNGRIDRYGQLKAPDIRYMLIESKNERIHGDMRIMEILIEKEEQAEKNIGDPALLMGKFNQEDEEDVVADAIIEGKADTFGDELDAGFGEFDLLGDFDLTLSEGSDSEIIAKEAKVVDNLTLYNDMDYLYTSINALSISDDITAIKENEHDIKLTLTDNIKSRLQEILPGDAMPKGEKLYLSTDKKYIMQQMRERRQNTAKSVIADYQFLWELHPLISWINNRASLLFPRGAAPVIDTDNLKSGEKLYIIAGSYPNEKSTAVIDEWFGLLYSGNNFIKSFTMQELIKLTGIGKGKMPNNGRLVSRDKDRAEALLPKVIEQAKSYMKYFHDEYHKNVMPVLGEEMEKLNKLEERRRAFQINLFVNNKNAMASNLRQTKNLYERFRNWVKGSINIQNKPYIRVVAVVLGAAK